MEFLFIVLSAITLAGAVGVVISKNTLNSALCLIGTMIGIAGLFAQLQSNFLAVAQIAVYAGAVMVLVVFVIMLIGEKGTVGKTSFGTYLLAGASAIAFVTMTVAPIVDFFSTLPIPFTAESGVVEIGEKLFGEYAFPFELTSLLILAAIQGAVMVARKRLPGEESPPHLEGN
jgi:NADH-quinone oxidoreductase subunit J